MAEDSSRPLGSEIKTVAGVPISRSETTLKCMELESAAYEDLREVLRGLREDVRRIIACIKSLYEQLETKQELETIRRDESVEVEIHFAFLRIIDVDTKMGVFHAEIFLQAKWKEPRLKEMSQADLDTLDHSSMWHPSIVLINAFGEPDDVKIWYAATVSQVPGEEPTIYKRMRVSGKFKETLELQDFPVDIQALTVLISCERPVSEVSLIQDSTILPTVTLETFSDVNEFSLYEHVQTRQLEVDPYSIDKYSRSSTIAYTCGVGRKPTYYIVNALLLQFLISSITMLVYVQDPEDFSQRTSLTAAMLLTSVALKFTTHINLPKVPYITKLEIYGIVCQVFLVLQMIENGVVFNVDRNAPDGSTVGVVTDRWCAVTIAVLFIIFNAVYIAILARKYIDNANILVKKEKEYKEEKRKREVNKYNISTGPFGKKYFMESAV